MHWIVDLIKRKYYEVGFGSGILRTVELDIAIRNGDCDGVTAALKAGATLEVCTRGPEGYYTAIELARQLGDKRVIRLLEDYRAARVTANSIQASTDRT